MDIQAIINVMSESAMYKRVATGQNMSLGELIDVLRKLPAEMPISMGEGLVPKSVGSYRGYYSDLAIHYSDYNRTSECLNTVGKLLERLEKAVGETFEGYKGGDFTMGTHTPMWCAPYGGSGDAIHAIAVHDGKAVMELAPDSD